MSNERRNIRKLTAARGVASPRRGAPAFTLLELLVALTMTAIIAGSLYSGLRTAFRARTSAETAVEPVRTAGLTLGLLRADIESALPARGVLAGPFVGVDGTGEAGQPADALEFFTLGDPGEGVMAARGQGAAGGGGVSMTGVQPTGAGEARKVQICVVPSPAAGGKSEQVLVRRVTTNLLSNVTPEPYEEVLCRGVRAVNVRYFDGLIWQDNWDSTQYDNNIPSAVEVTIELERAGVDGQVKVMRFPRVFLLSCSTLTAGSGLMDAAGGTTP
jgi:prepilin-type N-terminal cleavage/methylation domain-containing protein